MLVVYGKLYNLFGTNRFANGIRMINFSSDLHKTKHSERTNENRQETARVLCLFLSVLLVLCNISDIEVLRYWKIGRLGGETHSHSRTINGFNNAGWDSCWLFLKTSRDEFSSASAGNSRTVSKSKLKTLLLPWTVAAVVALLLLRARWKSVETELKMRPLVCGFFYTPPQSQSPSPSMLLLLLSQRLLLLLLLLMLLLLPSFSLLLLLLLCWYKCCCCY